jgi:hypothetical protein
MSSKVCFKCDRELPLAAFYRHAMMGDGHLNKCKECTKADVAAHRAARIEQVRLYDKQRSNLPHRQELRRSIIARWMEANPDRKSAQTKLRKAVLGGTVQKHPCWVCGEKAEAHHPDYSRPLDVVWLCRSHHMQAHAIARKAAAALAAA